MENNETKPIDASGRKPITRWTISPDLCTGCGECVDVCSHGLLVIIKKKAMITKETLCPQCGDCAGVCITQAIVLT